MDFSVGKRKAGFSASAVKEKWENLTQAGNLRVVNPYLPFLVFTLLGLLFLGGLGFPGFGRLSGLQQRLKESRQKLAQLRLKNVKLAELLSRQDVLKSDLSLVDEAVTDKENVPELLAMIEKIASESGVSVRSLHFGLRAVAPEAAKGKAAAKGVGRIYLQSEAEGPYSNLQTFLGALEKAVRVVDIETLRFNQEVVRETTRLRATLGLISFFLGKEKVTPEDSSVTLALGNPKLATVMEILKTMRVYKVEVVSGETGRPNPFE